jgi:hypothetical protein
MLGLFDVAAAGLADWSEFDEEAERFSIEVCGLSRQDLRALIEGSTREIPTTEHRRLHQEASDFVWWGRRGGLRTLDLYDRPYLSEQGQERAERREVRAVDSMNEQVRIEVTASSPTAPLRTSWAKQLRF